MAGAPAYPAEGISASQGLRFLHGNAKKLLTLVQRILNVIINHVIRDRPSVPCPQCQTPMQAIGFIRLAWQSG